MTAFFRLRPLQFLRAVYCDVIGRAFKRKLFLSGNVIDKNSKPKKQPKKK